MKQTAKKSLRILLELRPALGGHAGIPQATRLLFRRLAMLDGVEVEGLLQSGEKLLRSGLPQNGPGIFWPMSSDQQLNRLGRVVIAIEQGVWNSPVYVALHTIVMAVKHIFRRQQELTRFDHPPFPHLIC